MKFSPKPILRGVRTFLRKNDTKILKIAAYGVSIVGGIFAVKGGMEANEEIRQKEAELKESTQNPEATLPTKEKAKIVVKKVLPGGAIAIGGVVLNEWCFRILNKKLVVASAISEYATARNLFYNSADEQKDGKTILTSDKYGHLSLDNVEFDLYEPITETIIPKCTINKLIVAQMLLDQELQKWGDFYIDVLIEFLGGDLPPEKEGKYAWQETYIEGKDIRLSPMNWVSFYLTYDINHNDVILGFSKMPDNVHDKLLDKYVS